MKKSYHSVIFDLYGTLVQTYDNSIVLKKVASILDIPYDEFIRHYLSTSNLRRSGFFKSVKENYLDIVKKIGKSVSNIQINQAIFIRHKATENALKKYRSDTLTVLETLKQKKISIGLISDCAADTPIFWSKSKLSEYIQNPIFSAIVQMEKPSPGIYQLAIKYLKFPPDHIIYIGDGESMELDGAKKVGLNPILLNVPEVEKQAAERTNIKTWKGESINKISEVLDYLDLRRRNNES